MSDDKRPIIIKKIKKGGHGHHGGAWKVAYADFVTAMMAFFLLLWLLSSVEEDKLESLAEYFTPTIGVKDSMGIGFEGGMTANIDGTKKSDTSKPGVIMGYVDSGPTQNIPEKAALIEADKDAALFEKAEEDMKRAFESDPNLRDLADNIIVEQTPEGLKIEITDSDQYPMFNPGSISLTQYGKRVLSKMGGVIDLMPNFISITGHTDVSPLSRRGSNYTNWELSSDRANAARRYLLQTGMEPERPKKVVGMASTELLLPNQPLSSRNRRITIILLRGNYMNLEDKELPATRDLLSVPTPKRPVEDKMQQLREEEQRQEAIKGRTKQEQTPTLTPGMDPNQVGGSPVDGLEMPAAPAPEGTSPPADAAPAEAAPPAERDVEQFREFME